MGSVVCFFLCVVFPCAPNAVVHICFLSSGVTGFEVAMVGEPE